MDERGKPSYELVRIQALVSANSFLVTLVAADGARELSFDAQDVRDCIIAIDTGDFHKSMESHRQPGSWLDVYRPVYRGVGVYLKVRIHEPARAVIVSFKKDSSR